jgi:hypothetical protein
LRINNDYASILTREHKNSKSGGQISQSIKEQVTN